MQLGSGETIRIGPTNWPFEEIHIPFAERKAKVKWPNHTKLAVKVYITGEWGTQLWNQEGAFYAPDLRALSRNQYSFTVGTYRVLDLVEKYGIQTSYFVVGYGVTGYPALTKEFHRLGHEITCRAMDWNISPPQQTPEEQEADLRQATNDIAQLIGEPPVGWIQSSYSDRTPEILVNLGYLYLACHAGDDIPFIMRLGGKRLVVVPHRDSTVDVAFVGSFNGPRGGTRAWPSGRDPEAAFEYFRHTFDAYYQTATTEAPTMFLFGIHPQVSCWPDRVRAVEAALRYMKGFKDVWFARHRDIAQWWKDNYGTES